MTGIAADRIAFSYPSGGRVVDDWSAEFSRGSLTALTGPSGSGKSTLLYIIGLMHRQLDGDLLVGGVSTVGLSDAERARMRANHFGFVFQDAVLDPTRSVLDNIVETAIYRGQPRGHAIALGMNLMEQFGVRQRADHRPGQVSGGQAQRIALCRALLHDPAYILADEPTGNLDSASRDVVVGALRQRAEAGATVVIATHDPCVVAVCDLQVALGDPL